MADASLQTMAPLSPCFQAKAETLFSMQDATSRNRASEALSECMPQGIREVPTEAAVAKKIAVCKKLEARVERDRNEWNSRWGITKFFILLFSDSTERMMSKVNEYLRCSREADKMRAMQDMAEAVARRAVTAKDLFDRGSISRDEFFVAAERAVEYFGELGARFPNYSNSLESIESTTRVIEDETKAF